MIVVFGLQAMAPDTYRGPHKHDDPEAGPRYAQDVAKRIAGV